MCACGTKGAGEGRTMLGVFVCTFGKPGARGVKRGDKRAYGVFVRGRIDAR